ncbi:hypothetical protein F5X96DRAFT_612943, partial [Biscogniauxia mediterranea]
MLLISVIGVMVGVVIWIFLADFALVLLAHHALGLVIGLVGVFLLLILVTAAELQVSLELRLHGLQVLLFVVGVGFTIRLCFRFLAALAIAPELEVMLELCLHGLQRFLFFAGVGFTVRLRFRFLAALTIATEHEVVLELCLHGLQVLLLVGFTVRFCFRFLTIATEHEVVLHVLYLLLAYLAARILTDFNIIRLGLGIKLPVATVHEVVLQRLLYRHPALLGRGLSRVFAVQDGFRRRLAPPAFRRRRRRRRG